MKKIKDVSIKIKLPLMIGGISFIVMAVVCLLLIFQLSSNSLKNSSEIAQLSAVEAGQKLAGDINSVASVVRAYSGIISKIVSSDMVPDQKKREMIMSEMEAIIQAEKTLQNLWCIFEPNAVDGSDSLFINRKGSNTQGQFLPWITSGEPVITRNSYSSDFYIKSKKTGKEVLSEPYKEYFKGEKLNQFSICIPIVCNGHFIGAIGSDFHTKNLSRLISSLNNRTVGKLITSIGNVAVYHDDDRIGVEAEHGNRAILDKLPAGKMFEGMYTFEGREVYKVYVPIELGEDNQTWFYAIDVPKKDIYAQAFQTAGYLMLYCLAGVVLITLAGWFLIRAMLKGVIDVTDIIHQLSFGRIKLQIDNNQGRDEIGMMKIELGSMVHGLQRTAYFAKKIGEGDLDADYQLLSDEDVLGNSLLEMRRSLQKAREEEENYKQEERHRNWVTAGVAKFAEILRKDTNNLETLSYNIVSNLVKYLGANQGGIFLLNEDEHNQVLELKACYAFDRKKFTEKQIHPGEGLVGTCYLEGESIYLTEIPNSYIHITSGLGDSNPRALLISPLKVNDEIYGVIELASFEAFESYQLEFVEKVCESIASTISSVQVSLRTERLLVQTRLQAEEMANQEEELRQNMEEMQATQEEMRRREVEMTQTVENLKGL